MNIEWIADEQDVPALRRIVRRGDIIENVPDNVASSLIGQRKAEPVAAVAEASPLAVEPEATATAAPLSVSIPVMITELMKNDLRAMGYKQKEIDAMTPEQAHAALKVDE